MYRISMIVSGEDSPVGAPVRNARRIFFSQATRKGALMALFAHVVLELLDEDVSPNELRKAVTEGARYWRRTGRALKDTEVTRVSDLPF